MRKVTYLTLMGIIGGLFVGLPASCMKKPEPAVVIQDYDVKVEKQPTIQIETKQTVLASRSGMPKQEPPKTPPVRMPLTSNEKDLLARLVRAEAQSEPYAGKVAVATVVLNRIDSEKFPDTVNSVIYASGQFDPVRNGAINKPADEDSIKAVEDALHGYNDGSLFFYNSQIAGDRWLDSRPTVKVIGNHIFKK